MKKVLSLIITLCVVVGLFASPVSLHEAKQIAQSLGFEASNEQSKFMQSQQENSVAYYVIEDESGEGWIMIAADDVAHPILAYSETGIFNTENMPDNLRGWLSKYEEHIFKARELGITADEETRQEWSELREPVVGKRLAIRKTAVVEPLIKTKWDQDEPYRNLCPYDDTAKERAYTGCVATSMAQVMNYWQWPKRGIGSITYQPIDANTQKASSKFGEITVDFSQTKYDWDNMLDYYTYYFKEGATQTTMTSRGTAEQQEAVATLMYHAGAATQMMYGTAEDGGSGTYTQSYNYYYDYDVFENSAEYALKTYFGYKSSMKGILKDYYYESGSWENMLKKELDAGRPIMYDGSGSQGGHSFVCDGYDSNGKFHFNWGWSGQNDGYYSLSALNPGSGGAGGGDYNFSSDQGCLIGIEPNYDIEGQEDLITDFVANYGQAIYYPKYSDKENNNYNFSVDLYVRDDNGEIELLADFDIYSNDSTKIAGEYPYSDYSYMRQTISENSYFYIVSERYAQSVKQNANLKDCYLQLVYKSKDSEGYLHYDVNSSFTTTDGTVYTITAQDLRIFGWNMYDVDNNKYQEMTLTDDQTLQQGENYDIQLLSDLVLSGANDNHEIEYGQNIVFENVEFGNLGTDDLLDSYIFGAIYKLDEESESYKWFNFATAFKQTWSSYSYWKATFSYNEEPLETGSYMFVLHYSLDGNTWYDMGNNYHSIEYQFDVVRSTTTIIDNKTEQSLSIYPNPSSDYIIINSSADGRAEIINVLGQTLKEIDLHQGSNSVQVSELPCGDYIVRTNNNTFKFIKK